MSNELSLDVKSIGEKIKESIKDQFAALIPDDAFQKLIEQTINEYFYEKREYTVHQTTGYSAATSLITQLTPFQKEVYAHIDRIAKDTLTQYLNERQDEIKTKTMEALNGSDEFSKAFGGTVYEVDRFTELQVYSRINTIYTEIMNANGRLQDLKNTLPTYL